MKGGDLIPRYIGGAWLGDLPYDYSEHPRSKLLVRIMWAFLLAIIVLCVLIVIGVIILFII